MYRTDGKDEAKMTRTMTSSLLSSSEDTPSKRSSSKPRNAFSRKANSVTSNESKCSFSFNSWSNFAFVSSCRFALTINAMHGFATSLGRGENSISNASSLVSGSNHM